MVDVLVPHVVVVVVLEGTVVVVEDESVESVESVELVVSTTWGVIVVLVVLVLVLVVVVVLVEVDDDVLVEVDVDVVVVLAAHGAVVVVADGADDVVVLDGVVVEVEVGLEVVSVANPVGAVGAAEARLPADRMADRTTDPKRIFISCTNRGIRQSFPPPASAPVRLRQLSAQAFAIATRHGMPGQMA